MLSNSRVSDDVEVINETKRVTLKNSSILENVQKADKDIAKVVQNLG